MRVLSIHLRAARPALVALALVAVAVSGCTSNVEGKLSAPETGDLAAGAAPKAPFDRELAAACAGDAGSPDARILRSPYLQKTTSTSTAVLWTARGDRSMRVRVRRPDGTEVAVAEASVDPSAPLPDGRQYVAEVEGLEPGTIYCYDVAADGGPLVGTAGFRTAPAAGGDEAIRFAAFGDSGAGTTDQFAVFEQLVTVPMDFVVIGGDVAYDDGTLAQFERHFFDVYASVADNVPFFAASGNHEYNTDDAAPFRQVFALFENGGDRGRERWYSFTWGDLHVAVLDTEKVGGAQAAWLERDLAADDSPWTVVVAHKPPYSSGHHGSYTEVHDTFVPIFERHDVDLVLAGHDHHYERTRTLDGVTYIVTGGAGRGTRPVGSSEFTAFAQQVAHFTYIVIEDGELRSYAIDGTGTTFDTLVLSGGEGPRTAH